MPDDPFAGLHPGFASSLNDLLTAAGDRVSMLSGYRSPEEQLDVWNRAVDQLGPAQAQNVVALPGHSHHGMGIAADLSGDMAWIKQNVSRFGLQQPMAHEPWHVEPKGTEDESGMAYSLPPNLHLPTAESLTPQAAPTNAPENASPDAAVAAAAQKVAPPSRTQNPGERRYETPGASNTGTAQ